jgi:hypothetical protein
LAGPRHVVEYSNEGSGVSMKAFVSVRRHCF